MTVRSSWAALATARNAGEVGQGRGASRPRSRASVERARRRLSSAGRWARRRAAHCGPAGHRTGCVGSMLLRSISSPVSQPASLHTDERMFPGGASSCSRVPRRRRRSADGSNDPDQDGAVRWRRPERDRTIDVDEVEADRLGPGRPATDEPREQVARAARDPHRGREPASVRRRVAGLLERSRSSASEVGARAPGRAASTAR